MRKVKANRDKNTGKVAIVYEETHECEDLTNRIALLREQIAHLERARQRIVADLAIANEELQLLQRLNISRGE